MTQGTGLKPINVGLEWTDLVGKIVEIQTVRVTNKDKPDEVEYRRHHVGRLVGFVDEFQNDEVHKTTFFMEGASTYTHRNIEIDWSLIGVDPEQQLIQSLEE